MLGAGPGENEPLGVLGLGFPQGCARFPLASLGRGGCCQTNSTPGLCLGCGEPPASDSS